MGMRRWQRAGRRRVRARRQRAFYRDLLDWYGLTPDVTVSDPHLIARLHAGEGGVYVWVANPTRRARQARVTLSAVWGPFQAATALWGEAPTVAGREVTLTVAGRDVAVAALRAE